jgi:hypothetical protein
VAQTWERVLGTNDIVETFATGYGATTTLEAASGGKLSLSGTIVRDVATGRIVTNVGASGQVAFSLADDGGFDITHDISGGQVNTLRTGSTQVSQSGTVGITLLDGRVIPIDVQGTYIAREGYRLFSYLSQTGEQVVSQTPMSTTLAELEALTGDPMIRWATASEAGDRALLGYIGQHYNDLIEQVARAGGLPGQPSALGNTSEAVRVIVASIRGQMTSTATTTV